VGAVNNDSLKACPVLRYGVKSQNHSLKVKTGGIVILNAMKDPFLIHPIHPQKKELVFIVVFLI
jgi:hypothetical protein